MDAAIRLSATIIQVEDIADDLSGTFTTYEEEYLDNTHFADRYFSVE